MFCPKCGSILQVKKGEKSNILYCSCGFQQKNGAKLSIKDSVSHKEIEVIEGDQTEQTLPLTDTECPKCKHNKAYFWTVQTRASDEPETKFLRCEKCKHMWRDYS
jgi:DNA-directed RNA polymerase subunit M